MDKKDSNFARYRNQQQRETESRNLIDSILDKSIDFTKSNLTKFLRIYSNPENMFLDTKHTKEPLVVFLSNYEFKSQADYKDVLKALKDQAYFDTGSTFYAHFNDAITGCLFNSSYIKLEWIIEHMAMNGSFAEINNVVRFIFSKSDEDVIKFLNQIIDYVSGFKKDIIVYEAIIRYGLNSPIHGLVDIFKHIFSLNPKIEIMSITNRYNDINDAEVKEIVGAYLYKKTNDTKYLPQAAQDIFVF